MLGLLRETNLRQAKMFFISPSGFHISELLQEEACNPIQTSTTRKKTKLLDTNYTEER